MPDCRQRVQIGVFKQAALLFARFLWLTIWGTCGKPVCGLPSPLRTVFSQKVFEIIVTDLAFELRTDFSAPRLRDDLDPVGFARKVVGVFGGYIVTPEVTFTSGNNFFDFNLSIPIFNRVGNIELNARSVVIRFNTIKGNRVLNEAVDYTLATYNLIQQPIQWHSLTGTAILKFRSDQEYNMYLSHLPKPDASVTSSGFSFFGNISEQNGEAHLLIEKSTTVLASLFVSYSLQTRDAISKKTFESLAEWAKHLLRCQDLNVEMPL